MAEQINEDMVNGIVDTTIKTKMEEIFEKILKNGKYYQPASNHYLISNPIPGICHLCQLDTILTHQDPNNIKFCNQCVLNCKFMIKCDKCCAIFLFASIGWHNYDLCIPCVSELIKTKKLNSILDNDFEPHLYWCYYTYDKKYLYIKKDCLDHSKHKVYYENELKVMDHNEIVNLLNSSKCGISNWICH